MSTRAVRRATVGGIIAVMAVFASINPASAAFSDVPANHPFRTEITWASNNGIINGFPDGTFRGGAGVTREAASAFIFRLAANPAYMPPGTPTFNDVPTSHAFYKEIEWMAVVGVTTGFPGGQFRPSAPVTRQAMAAYICRLIDCYEGAPSPNELPQFFFDIPRHHPFFIEITFMYITEIADGYPYGFGQVFKPSATVTRQAATAFLYRLDQLVSSAGAAERSVPGASDWTDGPFELVST